MYSALWIFSLLISIWLILDTAAIEPKNSNSETSHSVEISDFSESACRSEEPPPPGEQLMEEFVPADLKPRLRERKLTEYPPVKKGTGDSGLCSIMWILLL